MAHADDIGKYEGPPCEVCRVSQFVGTCTHRPRKYPEYTFPDFTTVEFEQMKAQKDAMTERDRAKIANAECARWVAAMEEFGFVAQPGLSVKENLTAFGDWWARRKAAGN